MRHLQLMIKPASSNCNLRCSYCFYEDECRNRQVPSYGIMKPEILERVVKKALEEAERSCTFGFQGGEPMLAGLPFFERFIEYTEKYKRPETRLSFCLQTNGTLLDEKWTEFLKKHHFLVGVSMDGIGEIHDRCRKDAGGRDTFKTVLRNAKMLQKAGVEVNILCVLTKQSARKVRSVYTFLKKQGFYHHQYIPCLDPLGEERGKNPWSLLPEAYGNALKELFDLWYRDMMEGTPVSVREFDNWLTMLGGRPPEACAQMGRCSMQNIVEANGDVFPCDFYVLDQYRAGNVGEENFSFSQKEFLELPFFQEGRERGRECPSCTWYPLCRGGCRRDYTPQGSNYFCGAYREFFPYAIERLERLAAGVFPYGSPEKGKDM